MRKMSKKVVERETSRRGRATAAKLIEFAVKELDRVGPVNFDIDSVLRKSKISKGSLYHHYGSKNGLLVAVETQQFIKYLDEQNTLLRNLVETRNSASDFLTLMTRVMEISGLPENRELRKKRIRAITVAAHDRDLSEFIKTEQIRPHFIWHRHFRLPKIVAGLSLMLMCWRRHIGFKAYLWAT